MKHKDHFEKEYLKYFFTMPKAVHLIKMFTSEISYVLGTELSIQ